MDLPFPIPKKADFKLNWPDAVANHYSNNDRPPLDTIFSEHFFPKVKGHGVAMDDYFVDQKAAMFDSVNKEKVKFHNADADDPDWKVKN
jgi:hypothetical protein